MSIKETFEYSIQHASMQHSDTRVQRREDLGVILRRKTHVITLTEMTDITALKDLAMVNKTLPVPWQVVKPDEGDIVFCVSPVCRLIDSGGQFSVKGQRGPARLGGHPPRYNSWVTFGVNNEVITHHGVHTITGYGRNEHRKADVLKQLEDCAGLMKQHAQGRRISTGSGDLNVDVDVRSEARTIFMQAGVTTISSELEEHEATHGRRLIDFIWSLDMDSRVSADDMRTFTGTKTHSDHKQIKGVYTIRPRRLG